MPRLEGPRAVRMTVRLALGVWLVLAPAARADDRPHGLPRRVAWEDSRLVGSPEPPLPYTVEKTFTRHEWRGPLYVADEPGTDRLWVVQVGRPDEKDSRIVRISDDPASDQSEVVLELPNAIGYSVCFHPSYAENGQVFVFTNSPKNEPDRQNHITRYTVDRAGARRVDPASAEVVIEWKSTGHDGGDMAFGNDGYLYITTGDGTSDSDLWNSGQTLNDLLGSVLRIDVDRHEGDRPYAVPRDNPFVDRPDARPEIWAYGLRNPWRMTIDRVSGQLWVGNNGQDLWETAYLVRRGDNYGWSVYEGSHPFYLERRRGPTPIVPPTIEHSHAEFRSLTGGVVYRGERFPELDGAYVYGDYASGRIWAMKHDGQRPLWHREIADTALQIASFRVDQRGELLVTDHGGGLYRLVPAPPVERTVPFPTRLSQTGLFADTRTHRVAPGLIPYSVTASGWNDGAEAERFLAVPGEAKVGFAAGSAWSFPDGTALVQTLSKAQAESPRRIETRILLRQQGEWAGYSYRWNEEQSDAILVPAGGDEAILPPTDAGEARGSWRFPSRAECMTCHSRAANFVLGVTGGQLNRDHDYGAATDNQLRALDHIDFFTNHLPKPPAELDHMVDPRDESQGLEARARAYLQVNCSVCHVEAGGGNSQMQLSAATPRDAMKLIGARPQHDTFGITDAMLVAPGDPDRSVLIHRLERRGRGQMPPLVSNRVDESAVRLLRAWIAGLKPSRPFVRAWRAEDLLPMLNTAGPPRATERGAALFREVGCIQCHRIGTEGGTVGPDLNGLSRRLAPREVLESILEPSKSVAEEYAVVVVATESGSVHAGRIEREDERSITLRLAPPEETVTIAKAEILERRPSAESNMPAGIVNVLEAEEVLDLVSFVIGHPANGGTSP